MSKQAKAPPPEPRTAVPEPVGQLVALFAEHLPDVRFPGVDAARLDALAGELQRRADDLAQAEAALFAAREAHAVAHAELGRTASAALGYARVYAAEDARLFTALSEIELHPTSAPRAARAKRRTKARASDERVTKLPFSGGAEPQSATG
jgi:hypothetical protein